MNLDPRTGDILDYGDYRFVVAAVTQERKWEHHPCGCCQDAYLEQKVWVWAAEPVQMIQAGGETCPVLPVQEWVTTRWKVDGFDRKGEPEGDIWPPNDCKLIRDGRLLHPNFNEVAKFLELDWHLEPDKTKF